MTTINRQRWITRRIAFLEELLTTEITGDQRRAAESEIEQLRHEQGPRHGRFLRWMTGISLPHEQ